MHALVTGASGFIGRNLVRQLLADSWTVTVIVRTSSDLGPLEREVGGLDKLDIRLFSQGVSDYAALLEEKNPLAVFHLAAMSPAEHDPSHLDEMINVNIGLVARLLESIKRHNASADSWQQTCFVGAGSFWQHFDGTPNFSPTSLYASTKQAGEDLMRYYSDVAGVPCVLLKLFDVYGPRDTRGRLLDLLHKAALSGEALNMSPGNQIVDLVHVDDVSKAFIIAARVLSERPEDLKLAHNVPAIRSFSLKEVVAHFSEILGLDVPVNWGGRPYRPMEVMHPWRGDPLPDWQAEIDLKAGLQALISQK